MLKFKVSKQTRLDSELVVAGSRNWLTANFEFDEIWQVQEPKIATFNRTDKDNCCYNVAIVDGSCKVPWEVLSETGTLEISVQGGDLITTNPTTVLIRRSGALNGLVPTEASPSVYNWIVDKVKYITDTTARFLSGDFSDVDLTTNSINTKNLYSEKISTNETIKKSSYVDGAKEYDVENRLKFNNNGFSLRTVAKNLTDSTSKTNEIRTNQKTLTISADNSEIKSNNNVKIDAIKDITLDSGANLDVEAQKVKINSLGEYRVESLTGSYIKSQGHIGLESHEDLNLTSSADDIHLSADDNIVGTIGKDFELKEKYDSDGNQKIIIRSDKDTNKVIIPNYDLSINKLTNNNAQMGDYDFVKEYSTETTPHSYGVFWDTENTNLSIRSNWEDFMSCLPLKFTIPDDDYTKGTLIFYYMVNGGIFSRAISGETKTIYLKKVSDYQMLIIGYDKKETVSYFSTRINISKIPNNIGIYFKYNNGNDLPVTVYSSKKVAKSAIVIDENSRMYPDRIIFRNNELNIQNEDKYCDFKITTDSIRIRNTDTDFQINEHTGIRCVTNTGEPRDTGFTVKIGRGNYEDDNIDGIYYKNGYGVTIGNMFSKGFENAHILSLTPEKEGMANYIKANETFYIKTSNDGWIDFRSSGAGITYKSATWEDNYKQLNVNTEKGINMQANDNSYWFVNAEKKAVYGNKLNKLEFRANDGTAKFSNVVNAKDYQISGTPIMDKVAKKYAPIVPTYRKIAADINLIKDLNNADNEYLNCYIISENETVENNKFYYCAIDLALKSNVWYGVNRITTADLGESYILEILDLFYCGNCNVYDSYHIFLDTVPKKILLPYGCEWEEGNAPHIYENNVLITIKSNIAKFDYIRGISCNVSSGLIENNVNDRYYYSLIEKDSADGFDYQNTCFNNAYYIGDDMIVGLILKTKGYEKNYSIDFEGEFVGAIEFQEGLTSNNFRIEWLNIGIGNYIKIIEKSKVHWKNIDNGEETKISESGYYNIIIVSDYVYYRKIRDIL